MAGGRKVRRLFRRLPYICLRRRYKIVACCAALILVMLRLHHMAEVSRLWLRWPKMSVSIYLKASCRKLSECTPIPIDLVYTWVNGTDVSLQRDLMVAKKQLDAEEALLRFMKNGKKYVKPECPLSQCIVAPMVALNPGLPANMTTRELPSVLPSFSPAKALLQFTKPLQPSNTVSVVVFHSRADAEKALAAYVVSQHGITAWLLCCVFQTTDKEAPGLIQMETLAYLTGFPQSYKVSEMLRGKLSPTVKSRITAFELYPDAGIALLSLKMPQDFSFLLQLAKNSRLKLDGKKLAISPVYLFWDMRAIAEVVRHYNTC
uniref:Uncharacterized protein n=1 Tax=Hippocampus comes TaxID=109280 RepID=A0A3Q3DZE3_HIPCM